MPTCWKCGREVEETQDVQVSKQTHWEPAEYEPWCEDCCGDPDYAEEQRSLRGYSDEERERI